MGSYTLTRAGVVGLDYLTSHDLIYYSRAAVINA